MKKFQQDLKDPEYQKKMKDDMKQMLGGLMGGESDGKRKGRGYIMKWMVGGFLLGEMVRSFGKEIESDIKRMLRG